MICIDKLLILQLKCLLIMRINENYNINSKQLFMKPTLSFVEAIKTCFGKYATFSGRARRSEFWWFYLLTCIPGWCLSGLVQWKSAKAAELTSQLTLSNSDEILAQASSVDTTFYLGAAIFGIISLALLLPSLAAWVRRLHDVGKSGKNLLWVLACGIGGLIPLFMCIGDTKKGVNQYGEDPKYEAGE